MRFILSALVFTGLALAAVVLGLTITNDDAHALTNGTSQTIWIAGMISGILIAWIARIRWSQLPLRMAFWFRMQRRRIWWMACGALCVCVLFVF